MSQQDQSKNLYYLIRTSKKTGKTFEMPSTMHPSQLKLLPDSKDIPWIQAENQDYPGAFHAENSGKWVVFINPEHVDAIWELLKQEIKKGTLWHVKASHSNEEPGKYVVLISVPNYEDFNAISNTYKVLLTIGMVQKRQVIKFKSDEQTLKGEYAQDAYLFNSTNAATVLFHLACNKLNKSASASDDNPDSELKRAGRFVLDTVKKAYQDNSISPNDLPKLTQFVNGTTAVLNDSNNIYKIDAHIKNTAEVMSMNREWGRLIDVAMTGFLGVALITLSISTAITTFGASSPLSGVGFALGVACCVSCFTIGSAKSAASIVEFYSIFNRKSPIVLAGERVSTEANFTLGQ